MTGNGNETSWNWTGYLPLDLMCIAHSKLCPSSCRLCVKAHALPVWREDFNFTLYQKGPDSNLWMKIHDRYRSCTNSEELRGWGSTHEESRIPRGRNFLHGSSVPRVYKGPFQYWKTEEKECMHIIIYMSDG